MNIENERKLFEEWAKSESLNISKFISRGDYLYKDTQRCWKAWQASANREGFVLVENKPVAYMIQNKSWVHSHGAEYFEVKLLSEMPEPEFEGDSYDTEIPLYMIKAPQENKDD